MKLPISKDQHTKILPQILVVTFTLLLAFTLWHFSKVWGFIQELFSLATPFIVGFCIAYLLGPVQRFFETGLRRFIFRKKEHPKLTRAFAALFALLSLALVVYVFMRIMVPQLVTSVTSIVEYISTFLKNNSARLNQLLLKYDWLSIDGEELVFAWENVVTSQIKNITMLVDNLFVISTTIIGAVFDLLVGLITAFYIMIDKDHIAAQIKKIGYSIVNRTQFEDMIYWTRRANRIFTGFITGKIIDSAIIGVICYIGMLIFKMEYPLLISLVIGVTNVIPFFGPFIGWIPCTLILLIINPMSALWFSLFILFLQQLDGNVIGPHILGDYVGVSALSIMISIVIGGGLFGFVGMLVSVPVFALGYAFFKTLIHASLRKRNLPVETSEYVNAPENLPKDESGTDQTEE